MSNFFCAAPWRGLHINPTGDVKTCCAGNPNMLGNLNQQPIHEILNSDVLKQIRSSIAQGKPHRYCNNCIKAERLGAASERQWHNNVNTDFDPTTAGQDYHYPVIVDIRWNTTCNLSCNYCAEACSSKWASLKKIPVKSETRSYYADVCNFMEQHKDHIHEVALVGGEPLLLPENERLLDVIPDSTVVTLITNLSVDLSKNKIFQKLTARKRVGWSISFDNIEQRFEYVRHGAQWEILQHNLSMVKELIATHGHWGGIHAVYNIYNATHLCELKQFANSFGLAVRWQNLFQPSYLDPFSYGKHVADLAIDEIKKMYDLGLVSNDEDEFFKNALSRYEFIKTTNTAILPKFKEHINDIEMLYHTDQAGMFTKLWPELAHLCE